MKLPKTKQERLAAGLAAVLMCVAIVFACWAGLMYFGFQPIPRWAIRQPMFWWSAAGWTVAAWIAVMIAGSARPESE